MAEPMLESVILEVLSDNSSLFRTLLRPHQKLLVGRATDADLSIYRDRSMSSFHFRLECDNKCCLLTDCKSRNGTFVNGAQVERVVMQDGDEIQAGETTFGVRIAGGIGRDQMPETAAATPSGVELPDAEGDTTELPPVYQMEIAQSGLSRLQPGGSGSRPKMVNELLTREYPVFFLAHLKKLEVPLELGAAPFLFDWMPETVAVDNSPALLANLDSDQQGTLITQGWDKNGLVCLYSQSDPDRLLDHLRCFVRAPDDSVLGFCWPTVMNAILSEGQPDFVESLLQGVTAVMIEAQVPGSWRLFAREELTEKLSEMGFVAQQVEESTQ